MNQVDVSINGRTYAISCDAGQEAHVSRLARYLDQKVSGLTKSVGQVGDARLLVMASLLVVDELVETDQALKQARSQVGHATPQSQPVVAPQPAIAPAPIAAPATADEALLAETLNRLAHRIDLIVDQLETA